MDAEHDPIDPSRPGTRTGLSGSAIAAVWIFGAAAYFYLRFTLAFYRANEAAISNFADRLRDMMAFG